VLRALNLIEGYTKTVLGMDEQVRTCDRTYIRLVENDSPRNYVTAVYRIESCFFIVLHNLISKI
jgi:hypothetical protein